MKDAYRKAGVDIDAGEAVVDGIREAVRRTYRPEVMGDLGGFGGLFRLGKYRDPVLVSGTDGVGTKLLVAQRAGRHTTIGIDLVAMCVNDVAVVGAEPLFFLDYFATGKLAPEVAVEVVKGIAEGCRIAGCSLVGGETAEMPGMYGPGHYDLAGFSVGVVERDQLIDGSSIRPGDLLVGLPSSGLHSNGYSLVRHLVDGLDWSEEHGVGEPLVDALLRPTRIYVKEVLALRGVAKGFAHITGGGILENVPRVFPAGMGAVVQLGSWEVPPIFNLLKRLGDLDDRDLHRTFNMGVGMVVVVAPDRVGEVPGGRVIGEVVTDPAGSVVLA